MILLSKHTLFFFFMKLLPIWVEFLSLSVTMPSSTHSLKHRIITFCFWQEIILWDTLCSSTMYLFRSPGVRRVWERAYLVTAYSRSSVGDSNWSGYRAAVSFNPAQSHNLKLSPHVIPALDCASPTIFDQMDALNFLASMYFCNYICYALKLFRDLI